MSSGKFDFREVEKLQKQLEKIERERAAFYRDCANELAARLLAKVKRRTPVGHPPKLDHTKAIKVKGASGKSKSFLSKNGAILKQYWSGYTGGTLRKAWTVGEIRRNGDHYEIEVINPTEYASYVEYGHRQKPGRYVPALGKKLKKAWIPGQFMMTISEKEIRSITPQFLETRIAEWLGGCMDVK